MAYHSFVVFNVSTQAMESRSGMNLDILESSKYEQGVYHTAVAIVITSNDRLL